MKVIAPKSRSLLMCSFSDQFLLEASGTGNLINGGRRKLFNLARRVMANYNGYILYINRVIAQFWVQPLVLYPEYALDRQSTITTPIYN
ncbi:hypothetical protein [Sedimenticola sp.]|uniref:hypothetical protein n=1 Tax=Sedimenticola sp. TaxID=1940285 RepID=UPI002587090B|nr:hypothetical protein [Sedimenticola sp.]MCW8903186.1 hypothetical protein [Sedimenticola sp.]